LERGEFIQEELKQESEVKACIKQKMKWKENAMQNLDKIYEADFVLVDN
jgi:hypothetical protein